MSSVESAIRRRLRQVGAQRMPWNEMGQDRPGPAIHFHHANGFPFAAYRGLLEALAGWRRVVGLEMRPLWPGAGPPPRRLRWRDYADDLVRALDVAKLGPVVGLGHSMGATTTVYAAARRPDLFSALVLIEPAFVTRAITSWEPLVPFVVRRRLQPARATLRKPERWASREEFLRSYRGRGLFREVPEASLRAFGAAAVADDDEGGVRLVFPRAWEAHNYMCPASIWPELSRVQVPVVAMFGEPSIFQPAGAWGAWTRRHPHHVLRRIEGRGHLLPLEDPHGVAARVRAELEGLDSSAD